MAFSHSTYNFSHPIKNTTDTSNPVLFSLDLSELITQDGHSALFTVDSMAITAYKQGTWEKMPVKFALMNGNTTRVITHEPSGMSSKWHVDLNLGSQENTSHKDHRDQLSVPMAGFENEPFNRSLPIYSEDNKYATLNMLAFMMSQSLWVSDKARGALDALMESRTAEISCFCNGCRRDRVLRVHRKDADVHNTCISFPVCQDGYVCTPMIGNSTDETYRALCDMMALVRCAYADKLDYLMDSSMAMADSFPYADPQRDAVIIPYSCLKRVMDLYKTLSDYADSFAMVDHVTPTVKVLFESPCSTIGLVTGSLGITTVYGPSVYDVHQVLYSQRSEGEEQEASPGDLVTGAQLTPQVLLRRIPIGFTLTDKMDLRMWKAYFFRRPYTMHC